jgi:ribosomal protein L11 methyltransferase
MDMKCLEISVEVDHEAAEAVSALFSQYVHGGAVVEQLCNGSSEVTSIRVKTYLSPQQTAHLPRLEEALWHLAQIYPIPTPSIRWLSEADWAERWKADYGVQHIGRHWVIKPSWQPYLPASGEVLIELDPGMSFGTGLHPSTRLCMLAMEDCLRPGARVLDAGTGTGVLAIAAAKVGAANVLAVDLDPVALEVAKENCARNGVSGRVDFQRASLSASFSPLDWRSPSEDSTVPLFNASGCWNQSFDLVLMNILAKVIVECTPTIAACLQTAGTFVVSGITAVQEDWVRRSLHDAGLRVTEHRSQEDWVALVGRKESRHGSSRNA